MKRTLLCLLAMFFLSGSFAAAARPGMTEITTSGTGTVSLSPDIATVRAALQTNAPSANDAISQNNAIYGRIVAGLSKLGIARVDVALDYYNVRYNPRPQVMPAGPTGEQYGYTVARTFQVTVRKIAMAGTVTDACIDAGATEINGVAFGLSDRVAARAQAITKAIADARANAETIARSAGCESSRSRASHTPTMGLPGQSARSRTSLLDRAYQPTSIKGTLAKPPPLGSFFWQSPDLRGETRRCNSE
jgi:hypothetical protein